MNKSPTFQTHIQYLKCMVTILNNLNITNNTKLSKKLDVDKIIKYRNLSKVTLNSIETEIKLCNSVKEYSQVVAPWLPVKSYYYIYYLECLLIYLMNGNVKVFGHGGHTEVRSALKKLIENHELDFSNKELSKTENYSTIKGHKLQSGQNLQSNFYTTNECIKSLRSKLVAYDLVDFRLKNKIKRISTENKNAFNSRTLTLIDYFYHMRIKANYRDVDFLDFENDISLEETLKYINNYLLATKSYGDALKKVINDILTSRNMSIPRK